MRSSSLLPSPQALFAFLVFVLPEIVTAQSLLVETTRLVSCSRRSKAGDILHVNYRGTLRSDGTEFDSSYGKQPFVFTLGAGQVIKGWDQGLTEMCIGEARKLTVPPGLAYGSRDMGSIPPNSFLIFETELLGIDGVAAETSAVPSATSPQPTASQASTNAGDLNVAVQPQEGSEKGPEQGHREPSECKLLGKFALLVQLALGCLALLSLVWKRWRERPRRPIKVWSFDVSKQVVGSMLLHFANLFMSMLSSGKFEITTTAAKDTVGAFLQDGDEQPNPCSFYLLNLAIDTTIGIPILVLLLRILHGLFSFTPLANPPESLKSGNYGHPPHATWWLKQALIYFLGLFGMKSCVFVIFQLFPWLGWVGDWALRWTEGKEWVQITFVMLIFPLVMNAAQYWIIDSFIKDSAGDYDNVPHNVDSDEDEEGRGLMGQRRDSEDDGEGERTDEVSGVAARIKEANPLPLPIELGDDEEHQSSSTTDGGLAK